MSISCYLWKEIDADLMVENQKVTDVELEEKVSSCIHKQRANMLLGNSLFLKPNLFMMKNVETTRPWKTPAMASTGWLLKFMSCNNILLGRKTLITQKNLSNLTGKRVGYIMFVRSNERELSTELRNCNGWNWCVVGHDRKHHFQCDWGKRNTSKINW